MKKILIVLLILLSFGESLYADNSLGYSDWSTIPSGYQREESAIQYGVILPKRWSDWSVYPSTYGDDAFFQISQNFGSQLQVDSGANKNDVNSGTIYTWNFGELKHITFFYFDIDCYYWNGSQALNYIAPPLQFYVDGVLVASTGSKTVMDDNWGGNINVWGSTAELRMSSVSGQNRNRTNVVGSWINTELIKYSHVIEWYEPMYWNFYTQYPLQGGANSQKPATRRVYRYPLFPEIAVDKRYIYEDNTLEDIKSLASASDYNGDDITSDIVITKIVYDDNGESVINPNDFDSSLSDTIHVTYYVKNKIGSDRTKTVKIFILKEGKNLDFHIYDRYISKDYIYTLEDTSKWNTNEYMNILENAMDWLERK